MKVEVKSLANKKVGELDLPEGVFSFPYNEHLIHLAVRAHLAARRAGSHKTKTRSEIRATGRKPYRQKGTGRSRAGSFASPLRTGGGVAHGPQPRSHALKLTPREKRNALKSALSRKLADAELVVVDSLELESHRTGELANRLAGLGIDGKTLLVDRYDNEKLGLASRNNPALKAVDALGVTVYDVVDRGTVVCSQEALGRLVEVLSK